MLRPAVVSGSFWVGGNRAYLFAFELDSFRTHSAEHQNVQHQIPFAQNALFGGLYICTCPPITDSRKAVSCHRSLSSVSSTSEHHAAAKSTVHGHGSDVRAGFRENPTVTSVATNEGLRCCIVPVRLHGKGVDTGKLGCRIAMK